MFNQVILSIGRKLSAHLFTTCIFCILILVAFIGGLMQVISSVAFSAYLENKPAEMPVFISSTSDPLSLVLDGEQTFSVMRFNKSLIENASKSSNVLHTVTMDDKFNNGRSFLNTKILYTPYTANVLDEDKDKSPTSSNGSSGNSKSKTINSTVYKSVTPSITDRVIADLKKEEYLNQQRAKAAVDGIEVGENDEAIYIDGDDEEETNTPDSITEIETSVEKLPENPMLEQTEEIRPDTIKQKTGKKLQTIGARDKKSSKKPVVMNQKYKSFGFVDISDTDSSEAVDIDDDDYDDDDINSGSGDFSNQLVEQISQDWVAPTIEKIKAKKMNKQERIMKSFADNSYGIGDSSKEMDTSDPVDFVDKDDEQMISRKIAKAHKKKNAMQTSDGTRTENQKPSKNKSNNRQKSNNNKRKSKEQRYIDEYFSGSKTDGADGAEAELVRVCFAF